MTAVVSANTDGAASALQCRLCSFVSGLVTKNGSELTPSSLTSQHFMTFSQFYIISDRSVEVAPSRISSIHSNTYITNNVIHITVMGEMTSIFNCQWIQLLWLYLLSGMRGVTASLRGTTTRCPCGWWSPPRPRPASPSSAGTPGSHSPSGPRVPSARGNT